jgi:hypothetical protein
MGAYGEPPLLELTGETLTFKGTRWRSRQAFIVAIRYPAQEHTCQPPAVT